MSSSQSRSSQPFERFRIRNITFADVREAFAEGLSDFRRRPFLSMLFGLLFALFGSVFIAGLLVFNQLWMVIPAGVGFPLVAPFLAAGLYEMSRRYQSGETFSARNIFSIVFRQQRREFGWMAFVALFVFWTWIYQVRLLLALFLQWTSFTSFEAFLVTLVTTTDGLLFLGVGTVVGAVLATVLFSITVISMPLLLDQEIDFISAMILSVKTVTESHVVMLAWGAAIAVLTFIAVLPFLAGVIVILPILGHTTWHLYRHAIEIDGADLAVAGRS